MVFPDQLIWLNVPVDAVPFPIPTVKYPSIPVTTDWVSIYRAVADMLGKTLNRSPMVLDAMGLLALSVAIP